MLIGVLQVSKPLRKWGVYWVCFKHFRGNICLSHTMTLRLQYTSLSRDGYVIMSTGFQIVGSMVTYLSSLLSNYNPLPRTQNRNPNPTGTRIKLLYLTLMDKM